MHLLLCFDNSPNSDAAQQAEAKLMLQFICNTYEELQLSIDNKKQLHCIHALAMLFGILGMSEKVRDHDNEPQLATSICL